MEAIELPEPESTPFELSLRIRHPSIDPAEISKELRLQASHSFKAGQPRESRSSAKTSSVHTESYWLGALDPIPSPITMQPFDFQAADQPAYASIRDRALSSMAQNLDMALAWCTRYLLRTHAAFIHRLQAEGGEVRLLATLSVPGISGFTLTPDLGRVLSELGIGIDFELAGH